MYRLPTWGLVPATIVFGLLFGASQIFAVADHLVISEIQIGGTTTTDEFIELYNPTDQSVNLNNFILTKKTKTGSPTNLINPIIGIIPAHGYFLFTHTNSLASGSADMTYTSGSIAADNSVLLYSNDGTTVVDKVGLDTATDVETAGITSPGANKSIERKAFDGSTVASMAVGGTDEFSGNGWDSDNNSLDFVLRTTPQPQNSLSSTEPIILPSPTPTEIIKPTPTNTPEPSPTPSELPSPTSTPTPPPTPIPTISVSPAPGPVHVFSFLNISCRRYYLPFRIFSRIIMMPHTVCKPVGV